MTDTNTDLEPDEYVSVDAVEDQFFGGTRGGLVADAPGTDTVDRALETRAQAQIDQENLNWLTNQLDQPISPEKIEARDDDIPLEPEPWYRSVPKDIALGLVESPRQITGGLMDAVDAIADLGDELVPLGGLQIFDEKGNLSLDYLSPEEMEKLDEEGRNLVDMMTPDEAESTTGNFIRNAAQFVGPFAVASKAAAGVKAFEVAGKAAPALRAATAGALTDFAAFEGQEERLSDLIQSVPALENPVTEFLASDPEDTEIEGRLKNAIEGTGLGALADSVFAGIKAFKHWKNARAADPGRKAKNTAEQMRSAPDDQMLPEAGTLDLLGDATEKAPLIRKLSLEERIVERAAKEIETGVPDDVVTRSLTDRGLSELGKDSGVYVNWARMNTGNDVKKIIDDTATAMSEEIDGARRGIRTNKQTALAAGEIDAWDTLVSRRTGEPLNAEQTVAARELWHSSARKLGEIAQIASDNPTPENLYQFRRMMATHHAIQKEVIAARTETARALQIWAMPVGGNRERMRDINQALDMSGGMDTAIQMAQRIAAIGGNPNMAGALDKFVEKSLYAKFRDSIQEYWINALLSGPKTHLVNMMSNSAVIAVSVLERRTAASINQLIGAENGVEIGEAMAQTHGLISGFGDALRNAAKTAWTGQTGYGVNKVEVGRTRSLSSGSWNVRSNSWIGYAIDTFGSVTNIFGRGLQVADEFFKTLGYRMELHAQSYRQATQEIAETGGDAAAVKARMAEIIADPPESIRMEAAAAAAYQTFTNAPGKFAGLIQAIQNRYPMTRFILPFVNTPANILSYTFERTPLAPLTSRYRADRAAGGAKADLALAKLSLGTASILYAIDMGMRGQVTGSGPENRAEMQNWRRQGFQPYSVKIGDRWVAYNRLDPLGYLIGMGADIAEYVNNAEGEEQMGAEVQEAMAATVFSLVENMTSKSYMQGLANLMEAINEPERFAPAYFERLAGSFIPSGVAEVARYQDPVMRVSHDIITAMKRRLPGYSEDLPPRLDLWGREVNYESGLGKIYDAASPLYVSNFDPEPIDEAMERDAWYASMPSKTFIIDGERISLKNRPEIYARYVELQGATKPEDFEAYGLADKYGNKTLKTVMNELVTGKLWQSDQYDEAEDPEEKRSIAMKIISAYRRAARRRLIEEYPELEQVAERKRNARLNVR